jgi:hypothetical protein
MQCWLLKFGPFDVSLFGLLCHQQIFLSITKKKKEKKREKSWSLVTERDRANEVDVNLCRLGISRLRLKY